MNVRTIMILITIFGIVSRFAAAEKINPIAGSKFKTVIFEDDFSPPDFSKHWRRYKASSVIRDGVLVGIEEEGGGHAAVNSITVAPFSDVELSVDLKFEGSKSTNLTFNEQGFKGSHAGHICRVVVTPTKLVLRDGKTGVFESKIHTMRTEGKTDAATRKLLKTKEASFPIKLKEGKWYGVTVRIKGDVMQAFIDGELIGSLRSEGVAHATKDKVGLVTSKHEMHYDNIIIKVP